MSGAEVTQTKASQSTHQSELSGVKAPRAQGSASEDDISLLFRPCKLGQYDLRNRIVYA